MRVHLYDVIVRPIITEKTEYQSDELGQYTFEVHPRATKQQVREAVERIFDVEVVKVRTMIMPAKQSRRNFRRPIRRQKQWKKAIVTLAIGDSIDLFGVR